MDIKGAAVAVLRGLFDSIKGVWAVYTIDEEAEERNRKMSPYRTQSFKTINSSPTTLKKSNEETKVRVRVIRCCTLNGGIFLLSILFFHMIFLPVTRWWIQLIFGSNSSLGTLTWEWVYPITSGIFTYMWVVPFFFFSKLVNALLFQDIANRAYRQSRGRPLSWQSVGVWMADTVFSVAVQSLFLIQATLVSYIPIYPVGQILWLMHLCLLYSLYSFEYKWFNMRWELHKRLAFIERNWPYFIGFGLPLTLITELPTSWYISGGLFSFLFPLVILSANEANPVDDLCIYPLHFFSPVITISNMIFSKTIGTTKSTSVTPRPLKTVSQAHPVYRVKSEK